MQELPESLTIEDLAPVFGNLQMTIIQQEKTIKRLRERIAELENSQLQKMPLDEVAQKDLERVDGRK